MSAAGVLSSTGFGTAIHTKSSCSNPRHLIAAQTVCMLADDSQGSLQRPHAPCPCRTVSKLHDVLRPFVLRRIKADVENSLPAKQEIVLYAAQTEDQRKIDQQLRDNTLMVSAGVCKPLIKPWQDPAAASDEQFS